MKQIKARNLYRIVSLVCTVITAFALFPGASIAQIGQHNHPELTWDTIETEHFKIHYHNGEYRTPRIIAKILEEVYDPVTSAYKFEPDGIIDVVVRDHDDYSNGAAYFYNNQIEIWASSLDFLLRGTSNWLRNVITHEFTHMIQVQTARKLPRRIPALYVQYFGYENERRTDVLTGFPNRIVSYPIAGTVMPSWFAEGAAQYQTMREGYEAWDSHRDMILRTRALNNGVYSLSEMGVFGKTSIGNESVYNQGFSFITYLADTYGEDVLARISHTMSSPFVFTIEQAIKRETGINGKEVFNAWKTRLEQQYLRTSDKIDKNLKEGTIVRDEGSGNVYPQWSPSGESFVFLSNGQSDFLSATGLFLKRRDDDKFKLLKSGVGSPPVWDKSGDRLVYSKLTQNDNNSYFYDLYLYNVETEKEEKLTDSQRAHYPSFAPDEQTVYFVSSNDRFSTLNALDLTTKETRLIKAFDIGQDVFMSSVSPDGRRIVFALSSGFARDIAIMNSDGSDFQYLLKEKHDERNPSFSRDGKRIYYSSDKNGIYNIYEYDLSVQKSEPITNVLGGAFMPSINNEGDLVFSLYTDAGYKIAILDNMDPVESANMSYRPGYGDSLPGVDYDDTEFADLTAKPYELHYSSTFFMPRLIFDWNGVKLGFYTTAGDVLGKYNLIAGAAMNTETDRDLFALMDFRFLEQTLFLELFNTTRNTNFFSEPNDPQDRRDDVAIGYWEAAIGARQTLSRTQNLSIRASISRQNYNDDPTINGINFPAIRFDFYKGLDIGAQWTYRKLLPRLDGIINPSDGRTVSAWYWFRSDKIFQDFAIDPGTGFLDEIFKKFNYHRFDIDWKEYYNFSSYYDRSALTLHFQGGFISEPVDDFFYYFAGGIRGLKGYSYYSIEGRKMAILSATYRFPLLTNIGKQFGVWYVDKLYGSVGYQVGDAWDSGFIKSDDLKNVIDLGLRLDTFSFYSYPTNIAFNAAYGLNELPFGSVETNNFNMQGKEWKFFLTVLFGYAF